MHSIQFIFNICTYKNGKRWEIWKTVEIVEKLQIIQKLHILYAEHKHIRTITMKICNIKYTLKIQDS